MTEQKKRQRIKAPVAPPKDERAGSRIKAGPPGSPLALPGDPVVPQDAAKKPAKKN